MNSPEAYTAGRRCFAARSTMSRWFACVRVSCPTTSASARCLIAPAKAGPDRLHLQSNEPRGQAREPLVAAIGRSVLDDEVLPFDVPEISQPLPEGIEVGRIDRGRRSLEHADPVDLSRRLGLEGEGRGEQAEGDAGDEGAPSDHSRAITRSAKSSITRYCRFSGGGCASRVRPPLSLSSRC